MSASLLRLYDPDFNPHGHPVEPGSTWELGTLVEEYCTSVRNAPSTNAEYRTTVNCWNRWLESGGWATSSAKSPRSQRPRAVNRVGLEGQGGFCRPQSVHDVDTDRIQDFLNWVYDEARESGDKNPENTRNKRRRNLRAVLRYALDDACPKFPKKIAQRTVAGRHWFRDDELSQLYLAAGQIENPPRWKHPNDRGRCWQIAIVLMANYAIDTAKLFPRSVAAKKSALRVKHFLDVRVDPWGETDRSLPHGCLSFNRSKTDHEFVMPLSEVTRSHVIEAIGDCRDPERLLLAGGSSKPASFFRDEIIAKIDGFRRKLDRRTGEAVNWQLKDLRKTCATRVRREFGHHAARAVLGHAPQGVTEKHYADDLPILCDVFVGNSDRPPLSQPEAFSAGCRC